MLKRTLVPLAILLVAVFLLSACGGKTSSTTTNATTSAPQTSAVTTSKPVTTTSATTAVTTTSTAQTSTTVLVPTTTTTPSAKTPKNGGIFRFADPRGPSTTLGWFAEGGASGGMWSYPTFESLLEVDMNNTLIPCLATSYKIADDLKSITFTIRKGVKFHDGSDFNAAVAKWNIDLMIIAKLGVNYSYMTSVDAVDDYTLKVSISKYNNTMINTLAGLNMLSKTAFDTKGKEWMRWNPVGTGPFKFVSFERDVKIKFTKNTNYWRPGQPYLDGVEMYFVADMVTMTAAYQAGDYDAIGGDMLGSLIGDLVKKGSYVLKCYSGAYTLAPDSKNPESPWSNLKVRQALDYAIDREAITKARGFGYWTTEYQFANPDTTSYNKNLPDRAYNPAKAKQLLADAGFPNGFSTKLYGDVASTDRDAITAIQAYMQAVGIKTEMSILDFASYGNYRTKGWSNAVLAGMTGFFANHNQSTDFYWATTATYYPSLNKTDALQNLHLASLATKDYDPAAYQKVTQYLYDNVLCLPLWAGARLEAVQPYVQNSGFYQLSAWPGWRPAGTWMDK